MNKIFLWVVLGFLFAVELACMVTILYCVHELAAKYAA